MNVLDIIGLIGVMAVFFFSMYLDAKEERKWSK